MSLPYTPPPMALYPFTYTVQGGYFLGGGIQLLRYLIQGKLPPWEDRLSWAVSCGHYSTLIDR